MATITRAKHVFTDETTRFLEFILTKYPKCTATKDMLMLFKNVLANDDAKLLSMVEAWYDVFLTPISSKRVKYAKAIERYLETTTTPAAPPPSSSSSAVATKQSHGNSGGSAANVKTACLFHALAYRDVDAFRTCCKAQVMTDLDIVNKLKGTELDDEEKSALWMYMDSITRAAAAVLKRPLPSVPSREELAKHVRKRPTADTKNAVAKGFVTAVNALAESRGSDLRIDGDRVDDWSARWNALSCEKVDGDRDALQLLEEEGGAGCASVLAKHVPELDWSAPLSKSEASLATQAASMARVIASVPRGVMSEIEEVASQLATDLGSQSIENMSLDRVAREISGRMSKFSEKDLRNMISSMDMLSPALQGLMKSRS